MPSSISVAPALGHGLCDAQGYSASGYDAIDARRARAIGLQPGVLDPFSYHVLPGTGALQLLIDADSGDGALVRGVNVTGQGLYYVAPHSANMTLDVTPGDATNPRVDQVIVEVLDAEHDGGAVNDARVVVVPGTPTAGATLANRSGADPLTGRNYLRLADVLVDAGMSGVIPAGNIRDRRTWAQGAYVLVERTAGNLVRPAGSAMNWLASGIGPRVELSGVPVRVSARGILDIDGTGSRAVLQLWRVDDSGTGRYSPTPEYTFTRASSQNSAQPVDVSWEFTPSPGSYVFRLAGSAPDLDSWTLRADATYALYWSIEEIVRGSADNG